MVKDKKMPTINYKKKFKDALKIMNQKKLGVVVILKNKFIKGLVTDGDLRRVLKDNSNYAHIQKSWNDHTIVIKKFGRYPHRNEILKRKSTPEEIEFLKGPNSSW